ncbi:hypothetical protein A3Q56_04864 [Intoshia linei]|uniref:THIF-type NAD/FAD binding fold domain-containing protein n=1 Tax=Intoshia linei TaxID=1819745 RepID=A0A177B1V7_9BILA|nr:hypothetical protein A3Q56_04864 [Intoshia linei]
MNSAQYFESQKYEILMKKDFFNVNIVVIIGLNPLGVDICKNLVLAGIETINVYDDKVVTESDVNTNFLVDTVEDKTLMESVASKLSELNPHVKATPEKQIKMIVDTCLLNHKPKDEVDSCLNIL